jgi:hypothetical protein
MKCPECETHRREAMEHLKQVRELETLVTYEQERNAMNVKMLTEQIRELEEELEGP